MPTADHLLSGSICRPVSRVLLLVFLLLSLSMPSAIPVAAADDTSTDPFSGANIVFVIDQSGSMGGELYKSTVHPRANDPDDRRFEVPRFAINLIAQLRYTYEPLSDRDWDVRAGVVYFGDTVETPIQDLVIAPDNADQWQSVWDVSEPLVSPESFGLRNLGNTNIRAAIAKAVTLLDAMDQKSSGRRIRAIILVTDGLPVVVTGKKDDGLDIIEPWSEHMAKLRDTEVKQSFSGPDDRFYVVALNDADPYWDGGPNTPALKPFWQEIVAGRGFAELVPRNEDVTGYVNRAVNEIIDPFVCDTPGGLGCPVPVTDTVKVPPYLNQITFIVHKIKVTDEVHFINDGKTIDLDAPDVTRINRDRLVETITLRNPLPGIWQVVRPEGRDVTIYKYELMQLLFRFDLTGTEANLGCGRPVSLRVQALRPGDIPVTEIDGYPINVNVEIRWPDGSEDWNMGRPNRGVYEQRAFPIGHGNNAEVWVKATTNDPDNQLLVLYDGRAGALSAPECRCELAQVLPARMEQYSTITPTLMLVTETGPAPLEVTGEYETSAAMVVQNGGATGVITSAVSDGPGASVSIRPTGCFDLTLAPTLMLRDVQTGVQKSICTLPTQTIEVECRILVRMIPASLSPARGAACNLLGQPSVFRWSVRLEDDQGQLLDAAKALDRADQLPFMSVVGSVTTPAGVGKEIWAPDQLPPTQGEYEWGITDLAPGRYNIQLAFPATVASGYIKDSAYSSYMATLDLVAPANLGLWRALASLAALLLSALLVLLLFLLIVKPRLGPLPQGDLVMVKEGMDAFGGLGKSTIVLQSRKRQAVSAQQEFMLKEYCDQLVIKQDPAKWDRVFLTPVGGVAEKERSILMGGLTELQSRVEGSALRLEYKVDFEAASAAATAKRRADTRQSRFAWSLTGLIALAAAVAAWLWLPLGC